MSTENKWLARMERRPTTPGEALDDLMDDYGLNQTQVAEKIGVSRATVSRLIRGHHALTPDMAIRLGRLFGDGPRIWMAMQQQVDEWDTLHADQKPYAFIAQVASVKKMFEANARGKAPLTGKTMRAKEEERQELANA